MFADDIVLVDESIDSLDAKIEVWRQPLDSTKFMISRTKAEHMKYNFNLKSKENEGVVHIDGQRY